jgi:hypothetical protein
MVSTPQKRSPSPTPEARSGGASEKEARLLELGRQGVPGKFISFLLTFAASGRFNLVAAHKRHAVRVTFGMERT